MPYGWKSTAANSSHDAMNQEQSCCCCGRTWLYCPARLEGKGEQGLGGRWRKWREEGLSAGRAALMTTPPHPAPFSSCCLLNRKSHNSERSLDSYTRADISIPCSTRIWFFKKMCLQFTPKGRWSWASLLHTHTLQRKDCVLSRFSFIETRTVQNADSQLPFPQVQRGATADKGRWWVYSAARSN